MVNDRQHYSKSTPACSWRKRGQEKQALGRSRGGFSTKIHASSDSLGNPTRLILTGGEQSDYKQAINLIKGQEAEAVLADKGYDADYIVKAIEEMDAEVVIPPRSIRNEQREYDKILYEERNNIERMFGKLKHFRRVATRYDKLAVSYMAFVMVASIFLWLK